MRIACGVAAALVALTIAMTWPLGAGIASSLPGDYGDPLLVTWAMGWVSRTLTTALTQPSALEGFWNANIFYPELRALTFSEHFVGQSMLVLPVYWLTGSLIVTYNIAFLATFVLSGLGTFLLARALTESAGMGRARGVECTLAGITAAVVVAFNQYRLVYEVAHLQVLSIHWLPFGLYGLHRYLVTDSRRALALGSLALVALNVSSIYYMAYCAPFIVLFVLIEMLRLGRWREMRVWLELWAAGATVVVFMLPFLLPYMDVQQRLGIVRSSQELVAYSATLDHYRTALPGLILPSALAVIAVLAGLKPRGPTGLKARHYVLTFALLGFLVLSVWLSLGPVIQAGGRVLDWPGLYTVLYNRVPGYNALRAPSRFAMLFFFFLALLAGLGANGIASWAPRLARPIVALVLIAYLWHVRPLALPLDQALPSPGLAAPPAYLRPVPTLPTIYREVQALSSDAVLLELPFGDPWYELRYMFFAAIHGRRLVNGYSAIFPLSYLARQRALAKPLVDPERAAQAITGATHVIVHRGAWPDGSGTAIASWLEALGARLITGAGDALLYEIRSDERLADFPTPAKNSFSVSLSLCGFVRLLRFTSSSASY